ncbi:MAG TPA: ATP-binding cassette domain-containing protein [Firmicutes bacterium]|nr:ATP-binding cassette domain-containing protein [Bacillota bacterium]
MAISRSESRGAGARLRQFISTNFRLLALLGIILALIVLFTFIAPNFLSFKNAMNIVGQIATLAFVAIGMTFVILTGGIDLSVGSSLALAGVAAALAVPVGGSLLGFLAAIGTSCLVGLINGLMIGKARVSPFMATLAMMALARGLTIAITDGKAITVIDPVFNWLAQGMVGPMPVVLFTLIPVYLLWHMVLTRHVLGRYTYAVGGNELASRASGLSTGRVIATVYTMAGFFVGIGSIVTVGRLTSAQPLAGLGLEFEVITAVVLGGTSLAGGEGDILGTILGVCIVGILTNGLGLIDIVPFWQYVVKGIMILAAVLIDQFSRSLEARSRSPREARVRSQVLSPAAPAPRAVGGASNAGGARTLVMEGISKAFPGVQALNNVNFDVHGGEVHAMVGENGAGKSTLIKILGGVYQKDSGRILIDGNEVDISNPHSAQNHGISIIHQEFSLVSGLDVGKNIFLGKEPRIPILPLVNWRKVYAETKNLFERLGVNIDPKASVASLTVGQQQMVEIAKALNSNAWVIVMDEPTSALTDSEKATLFGIIRQLREKGVGIVYITHRMAEIFEIADRVTVLRDGQYVGTRAVSETNESEIIQMMVGRELGDIFKREPAPVAEEVLRVEHLTRYGAFRDISFSVRRGEVLGLAGLMGAGRTEVVRCIFGLDRPDEGRILINGREVHITSPREAIAAGIGLVPEDRRREGFVPLMSVQQNLALPSLPEMNRAGWVDRQKEESLAVRYISGLNIKTPHTRQRVMNLSGGNQQKVVLGKWLARNPRLLILDEPTRGIDVGAKAEIHALIERLAKQGLAILLISSELPEIMGVCDRIIVLHEGEVTGEFTRDEATQEKIMRAATGTESLSAAS